jgi:hypothetical protein
MRNLPLLALIVALPTLAQDPRVRIEFKPQDKKFETAAEEYRRIWKDEGTRMLAAMERVSGLKYPEKSLKAIILEAPSSSGRGSTPMNLRASYPTDVKKATLIHELGHRMNIQIKKRPSDVDEHRLLFLYLYEVWESLYGQTFADEQVKIESGRRGLYDYESAWKWALSMTKEERAARFANIRAN